MCVFCVGTQKLLLEEEYLVRHYVALYADPPPLHRGKTMQWAECSDPFGGKSASMKRLRQVIVLIMMQECL